MRFGSRPVDLALRPGEPPWVLQYSQLASCQSGSITLGPFGYGRPLLPRRCRPPPVPGRRDVPIAAGPEGPAGRGAKRTYNKFQAPGVSEAPQGAKPPRVRSQGQCAAISDEHAASAFCHGRGYLSKYARHSGEHSTPKKQKKKQTSPDVDPAGSLRRTPGEVWFRTEDSSALIKPGG